MPFPVGPFVAAGKLLVLVGNAGMSELLMKQAITFQQGIFQPTIEAKGRPFSLIVGE